VDVAALILTLNAGSSSLKASLIESGSEVPVASETTGWGKGDRGESLDRALAALRVPNRRIRAVAHRVVHGGQRFTTPVIIDDAVVGELEATADLAPLHNAVALELIRTARSRLPDLPHVACFDTAFHTTIPEVAWRYPVPYEWAEQWGIRRFGFHGLSVEWSVHKSAQLFGRSVETVSLVVAHLGSGCSITAVENGRSKWTSMGFTPLEGVMMATRSGSIDPGIVIHTVKAGRLTLDNVAEALEHRSGLLGVSGISGDIRRVRHAARAGNKRASLALEMFVARAAEGIAAAMTWVAAEAVVFTGGIGEHDEETRSQIIERVKGPAGSFRSLTIAPREDAVMASATAALLDDK
jgi:acetate kinase